MKDFRLRGFAEQRPNGTWYAHCIDLCLDAEAPTYHEVRAKLDEAIIMYIQWALPAAKSPKDILRRSPLEFQFRYWRRWASEWLSAVWGVIRERSLILPVKAGEQAFDARIPLAA